MEEKNFALVSFMLPRPLTALAQFGWPSSVPRELDNDDLTHRPLAVQSSDTASYNSSSEASQEPNQ